MAPDKTALRKTARELRKSLHEQMPEASEQIAANFPEKLLSRFGPVVAGYIAIGSEIDPAPLLNRLSDMGADIALPRVESETEMTFRFSGAHAPLEQGPFGLTQPDIDAPKAHPTLVITPLLGFDAAGNRLGYGKGHYDRALERIRKQGRAFVCGIAYSGQQLPFIPAEPTDIPLDWVVTEKGSIPLFLSRARG
ncbi:5-formyltetrahydrofolate cyclo-ligase [Ponticaulis sp.]|uniref:5-formyltetrahydrofolate cyclo-ligase n=1 Tax=Ponticaulis sp. TaxID=2020902 RepID=UPI000B760EAE|nr:5-formyltetrahydrofolate cyclo-ligase [Ponticaulis sp.]MAI90627.1 5-formyltetrahydrofolate cyclo-ligase [Ponticaulis sp.]OUX99140.1 MAG: 5-formyltetrahydrofolate cyclo-ligase [Hyphomonadaceae bacterium TMED5]|tara:strand:- start:74696 stop:75277 length:582 start_codon:yes stop_codon:yes gene_type:complete